MMLSNSLSCAEHKVIKSLKNRWMSNEVKDNRVFIFFSKKLKPFLIVGRLLDGGDAIYEDVLQF